MQIQKVIEAFKKSGKRFHLIGNDKTGVLVALDMEGRLFTVLDEEVLNRVNIEAIFGESTRDKYLNPGGDVLWPAPEGTTYGYQYPTNAWRVSPSLRNARFAVTHKTANSATICSEVDLINNQGLGVPTIFKREITISSGLKFVNVKVVESITYIGEKIFSKSDFLLAPWTLCQFECGSDCEVTFAYEDRDSVWDLYEQNSEQNRRWTKGVCHTTTDGTSLYQIGIDKRVPWIEYHDPRRGLVVRRQAEPLLKGNSYIDISDSMPNIDPSKKGVRYSVYSDPDNFMEIEAVGGCPDIISPNTELYLSVNTQYSKS